MMQLRSGAITGPGRVRQVNQDRYSIQGDRLFVVADGMGGHRGGEVAAQLTIDAVTSFETVRTSYDLETAIVEANRVVFQRSGDDPELSGMGTTITAIALVEADQQLISVANVGDSRTYRLTATGFEQLTEDHSVISELLRDGRITAEEAVMHRHRSVITRALGVEATVDVDIIEVIPTPGDRYLLCSDGLHGELAESAIASILRRFADPTEACEELMAAAMAKGGRDNITAVVVDVIDDSDPAFLASNALGAATAAVGTSTHAAATNMDLDSQESTDAPTPSSAKSGTSPKVPKPDVPKPDVPKALKVRKPSPINLRVLLFIAVLAGLAAVVAWVWRNAPANEQVPTTDVVVTVDPSRTPSTLTLETSAADTVTTTAGAAPVVPSTASAATDALSTTTGAPQSSVSVAPPITDPFAEPTQAPTTTAKKSSTTKKRK